MSGSGEVKTVQKTGVSSADYAQHDFPAGVTTHVAHRPWPLPSAPWILRQSWHDLLFAHWPVSVNDLRTHVPAALEIDRFDGRAWLGIVPFVMTNVALRGVPAMPGLSRFPELNVRTYVSAGGKPGVFFFSLDAGNAVAVAAAREVLNLPYHHASMTAAREGEVVRYASRRYRSSAAFEATYRPTAPPSAALPGTLEHFLVERYCLYSLDQRNRPYRLEIHHAPWSLQPADADVTINTMADAAGLSLPAIAPLLHFSKRQDTVTWLPERL
jgi:uncharacterized protein YqjF (DUF2071 family)